MSQARYSRRRLAGWGLGAIIALRNRPSLAQEAYQDWAPAPIGWPDRVPGDGFLIGHGFACENTWFAAGWWHTGEDWYAANGDSAGANVYAVAGGEVVYADFNYPGRVVIVQHAADLFSMYGHLDPELRIETGQNVTAGDLLGVVLGQAPVRGPGQAPSHLHFEVRTFLTSDNVNGATPQYGVNCGFQCPPGPGYWPASATEHPADMGWRNPTHARFGQLALDLPDRLGLAVNTALSSGTLELFAEPDPASEAVGVLEIGTDLDASVREVRAGDPASTGLSAESYDAWLRIVVDAARSGWVRGAIPNDRETGSDGRPSSLDLPLLFAKP